MLPNKKRSGPFNCQLSNFHIMWQISFFHHTNFFFEHNSVKKGSQKSFSQCDAQLHNFVLFKKFSRVFNFAKSTKIRETRENLYPKKITTDVFPVLCILDVPIRNISWIFHTSSWRMYGSAQTRAIMEICEISPNALRNLHLFIHADRQSSRYREVAAVIRIIFTLGLPYLKCKDFRVQKNSRISFLLKFSHFACRSFRELG